jgi:hypothetical protein
MRLGVAAEDRAAGGERQHCPPRLAGVGAFGVGPEEVADRRRIGDDEGRPRRQQPDLEDVPEPPLLPAQEPERVAVEGDRLGDDTRHDRTSTPSRRS